MLSVRPAEAEDLAEVDRMARQELGLADAPDRWHQADILVARDIVAGRIVGFVQAERRDNLEGHIGALAVAEERRHQGIGGALLGLACDRLTKEGAKHVSLEARMDDPSIRSWYGRFGFQPEGCPDEPYEDGTPAVRLGRPV